MEKAKKKNIFAEEKNNSYNKKDEKFVFEKLPEIKERSRKIYIITFILFVVDFLGISDFILKKLGIEFTTNTIPMIYNIVSALISSVILFIILKETIKRDFNFFIKNKIKYLDFGLTVKILCGAIEIAIFFLITMLIGETSANETQIEKLPFIYLLIYGSTLGPFIEECVFRGLLKKIIKNKYLFLGISSIFFGFMHLITVTNNLMQFFYVITYSIAGFSLAYIYEKTDNLALTIVIHMIINFVGIIL